VILFSCFLSPGQFGSRQIETRVSRLDSRFSYTPFHVPEPLLDIHDVENGILVEAQVAYPGSLFFYLFYQMTMVQDRQPC